MRRTTIVLAFVLSVLTVAPPLVHPAFAHGFGQGYDLPLPLWLYPFGVGAAVLASFVPISLFAGRSHARKSERYPRYDLLLRLGPLRAVITARAFVLRMRLLAVVLFCLVIISGLLGSRHTENYIIAPTLVWIIWWVGLSFSTAFVGNVWPLVNPLGIQFEWADGSDRRLGTGLELHSP